MQFECSRVNRRIGWGICVCMCMWAWSMEWKDVCTSCFSHTFFSIIFRISKLSRVLKTFIAFAMKNHVHIRHHFHFLRDSFASFIFFSFIHSFNSLSCYLHSLSFIFCLPSIRWRPFQQIANSLISILEDNYYLLTSDIETCIIFWLSRKERMSEKPT